MCVCVCEICHVARTIITYIYILVRACSNVAIIIVYSNHYDNQTVT